MLMTHTVERGRLADGRWFDADDFDGASVPRFRRKLAADRLAEVRKRYLVVACIHTTIIIINARRRLRSSTTSALVAPRTVRATIGDRTFPAAAASVWNSLPESVSQYGHRRHCKFFAAD